MLRPLAALALLAGAAGAGAATLTVQVQGPDGAALADAVVFLESADARAAGRKVVPACSYVAKFIERHAEYQNLL